MFNDFINADTSWLVFWLFVGVAIIIQGISKSGFAGGAGILSLPLMMLVMPVPKVTAALLPLLILCDFNAVYHHWHNKKWRHVLEIFIPSVVGIVAGAAVWWWIGRHGMDQYSGHIKKFVGVLAVLFAFYIAARDFTLAWAERWKPGTRAAWPLGIAAGFCSTIAHAAGPIVGFYLFAQGMGKTLFVGTVAWTFTLINLTKLPFYAYVGLIQPDVLLFDLVLVWLIPIGSYLGKWMHYRVPERPFNYVIMVLTLLSGIQLIFNLSFTPHFLRDLF
ncbi:MAG: sulfite exporter TauE/SafE family protein [Candidatus Hydrogenedentes bacterium]|nr:sulfite exporter TauE/SafE family protein [Candidatus Hydrogenedentota bacterium]